MARNGALAPTTPDLQSRISRVRGLPRCPQRGRNLVACDAIERFLDDRYGNRRHSSHRGHRLQRPRRHERPFRRRGLQPGAMGARTRSSAGKYFQQDPAASDAIVTRLPYGRSWSRSERTIVTERDVYDNIKAKTKGSPSDVSECKMADGEKAQLVEAKRKELPSFFEDGVWWVASDDCDPRRNLKPRWALTWSTAWSTKEDGSRRTETRSPRATRIPDALTGQLNPSWSTASRTSRNAMTVLWASDVSLALLDIALPADALRGVVVDDHAKMTLRKTADGRKRHLAWLAAHRRHVHEGPMVDSTCPRSMHTS